MKPRGSLPLRSASSSTATLPVTAAICRVDVIPTVGMWLLLLFFFVAYPAGGYEQGLGRWDRDRSVAS